MKRFAPLVFVLALSACADGGPTAPALGFPSDVEAPSLGILDGAHGENGNSKFYFLKPLTGTKRVAGEGDSNLAPIVEVCPRNEAGDGCDSTRPLLATFSRDADRSKDQIKVNRRGEYTAKWHMRDYAPDRGGVYRISVLLAGQQLGFVDVIAVLPGQGRNDDSDDDDDDDDGGKDKKDGTKGGRNGNGVEAFAPFGDELVEVSNAGVFQISFALLEGVLEEQVCDYDGDGDVVDCDAGVEDPTDGLPTVLTVVAGNEIAAVVTAPDGVFTDSQGNPIDDVVFTAELEIAPPSQDVITDDTREHPYFIEINTFPDNVFIDPNGPGVQVVICQDEAVLLARGIPDALHPQLILYKVTDPKPGFPQGETKRLSSTFGAPECSAPVPSAEPVGIAGAIRTAAADVLGFFGPEPLRARRLHGGLNTVVVRDISSSDAAFSTFGATLGPNASQTTAIVPGGNVGAVTSIVVEVRTALGELMQFGGDVLHVSVTGANNGAPATVIDNDDGTYSVSYTPMTAGTDSIAILLETADGWPLGPISASPYESIVDGSQAIGTYSSATGPTGVAVVWDPANGPLTLAGPNGTTSCPVNQPDGGDPTRSICLTSTSPTSGPYSLTTTSGSVALPLDPGRTIPAPVITSVRMFQGGVQVWWTGDSSVHGSFLGRIIGGPSVTQYALSSVWLQNGVGVETLEGTGLTAGATYTVEVIAFRDDLTGSGPVAPQFDAAVASTTFVYQPSAPLPDR